MVSKYISTEEYVKLKKKLPLIFENNISRKRKTTKLHQL